MKRKSKLCMFIFIYLIFAVFSFAEVKDYLNDLYKFFPSAEEMEGGTNRWLITDINKTLTDNYVLLERNYNSFNEKPDKIWDIQREKNFNVNVKLFFCKNFSVSENLFKKLSSRKVPFKRKVRFGDEGIMLIEPIKSKFMKADYELIFINKTFVLSLQSRDGFALMDFSDYFESKIAAFILSNFDKFFINKLKLEVTAENYNSINKSLTFVENDISGIKITGKVVDELNKPISGAKVILKDFKLETTTDESGKYEIFSKLEGKNALEFVNNFVLKSTSIKNKYNSFIKIFSAKVKYKMNSSKEDDFFIKLILSDNNSLGRIYEDSKIDGLKKLKIDNESIKFIKDCSNAFGSFKCRQIFNGEYDKSKISGNWKGTGGGGIWKAELLDLVDKKVSLNKSGCSLKTVILDLNGKFKRFTDRTIVFKNDEEQGYLMLKCDENKIYDFFTNKVFLNLTHISSSKKEVPLMLYNVRRISNIFEFINGKKIGELIYSEEPYAIKVDTTNIFAEDLKYVLIGYPNDFQIFTSNKFGNIYDFSEIRPYFIVEKYANKSNVVEENIIKIINDEFDFASNKSKPNSDGKKDLHIRIENLNLNGYLSYVEISFTGEKNYVWNTNLFDIYPGIVIRSGGKLIKNDTGELKIDVKKGDSLDFFMYKPNKLSLINGAFFVKLVINNRQYVFKIKTE